MGISNTRLPAWLSMLGRLGVAPTLAAFILACSPGTELEQVCADRTLDVGFFADFIPISYSQDPQAPPGSAAYEKHLGYESDLLTALEALNGAGLSFSRRGIPTLEFDGIWLLAAGPDYDLIGGGITIRDDRTRDAAGNRAIRFTSGHVLFRQSLLVRSQDAERLAGHDRLTQDDAVSVHPGTTGELRLLELTGIVDGNGRLVEGTVVETPAGTLTVGGGDSYFIRGNNTSPELAERQRIVPPVPRPQVIYHRDEEQQIGALRSGEVAAVARGELGNTAASQASGGAFVIAAVDPEFERGGFALDAQDAALASCLDLHIDRLTDGGSIGYAEWAVNPNVFMERAVQLNMEATRS